MRTAKGRNASGVRIAVNQMAELTGQPRWFCKNIILWRAARNLPIEIGRAV